MKMTRKLYPLKIRLYRRIITLLNLQRQRRVQEKGSRQALEAYNLGSNSNAMASSFDTLQKGNVLKDFPGGPVAKTSCSQCRAPGFHPTCRN